MTFLGEAISVPPNVLRPWPRCTAAAVLLACRRDVYIRVDSPDGEMMTRFSVPILGASANDEGDAKKVRDTAERKREIPRKKLMPGYRHWSI